MITLDGPTLAGLAALITSLTGLITALRAGRARAHRRERVTKFSPAHDEAAPIGAAASFFHPPNQRGREA